MPTSPSFRILRNLNGREGGSAYMEIHPGPLRNRCWNSDAIFFDEDSFEIIELLIQQRVPNYCHYSNTNIDGYLCWDLIRDLDQLANALKVGNDSQLTHFVSLTRMSLDNPKEDIKALQHMIEELTNWLRDVMTYERSISILGI